MLPSLRSRWRQRIFPVIGFAIGLVLLVVCIRFALDERNQQQLIALRHAHPGLIAALLFANLALLFTGGTGFWAALLPLRRLHYWDYQATNAIAVVLAYVPFKLSLVFRVMVHHRRDRLPLVTIGAWFAAFAALMLATLGPLIVASLLTRTINVAWFILAAVLLLLSNASAVLIARRFAGPRGWERLQALAGFMRLGAAQRLARSKPAARAHEALRLLTSARHVAALMLLRLVDLFAQAARFYLAAQILGTPLDPQTSLLLAATHFFLALVSPSGMVGTREAGTTGVAALLPHVDAHSVAAIALLILVTETLVNFSAAAAGVARLGPRRMFTPPSAA